MRLLLSSVVAAVVFFGWGFVYWNVLPYPKSVWVTAPQQDQYVSQLQRAFPTSGVYRIPGGADSAADAGFAEEHQAGPLATIMYHKEGAPPMSPRQLVMGFLHMLGASLIAGILVLSSGRTSFFGRFMVVFWAGILVAFWGEMSKVIWLYFPMSYAWVEMAYYVSSSILLGMVFGWILRPVSENGN
jgi:hypothetical protein